MTISELNRGERLLLNLGQSLRVRSTSGEAIVCDASENAYLAFRIDLADFFLIGLRLQDRTGKPLVSVEDNRLVHSLPKDFSFERIPGRIIIRTEDSGLYVPEWLNEQLMEFHAGHGEARQPLPAKITLLEMETIGPSQVRVAGLICDSNCAFLIEKERTYMVTPTGCATVGQMTLEVGAADSNAVFVSAQRRNYWSRDGRAAMFSPGMVIRGRRSFGRVVDDHVRPSKA